MSATGQELKFSGRVVDKRGNAISSALVETVDSLEIMRCGANGVFHFNVSLDSIEYIVVSRPGFDTKEVQLPANPKDSIIVVLSAAVNQLGRATISAKGGHVQEMTAGKRKTTRDEGCYLSYKDEIALYLPADSLKNGTIKEIGFYIAKDGRHDSRFVAHLYRKDTITGAPGEEITDSLLVLHGSSGGEWVRADLSEKLIQIRSGVFLSMELSLSYADDYFMYEIKANHNYYAGDDSLKTVHNGQVLGLTWLEGQPTVYRRYAHNIYEHKHEDEWFKTLPLVGGHRGKQWITPMMYATYTYIER